MRTPEKAGVGGGEWWKAKGTVDKDQSLRPKWKIIVVNIDKRF